MYHFCLNPGSTVDTKSTLWILRAGCFSPSTSIAAVQVTHPYISSCSLVNTVRAEVFWGNIKCLHLAPLPNTQIIQLHYTDVIITTVTSQTTSLTVVYSIVYSGADQGKHQSSASLAFVRGSHRDRWIPRRKGLVTRKMFSFDDVIMCLKSFLMDIKKIFILLSQCHGLLMAWQHK